MADTAVATTLSRPQPLGVFPLPAGYLLIPDGPGHDQAREWLAAGRLPPELPEGLAFYRAALDGELEQAASLLPDDLLGRINRLVLEPTTETFGAVTAEVATRGDRALICHVATLGFILGLRSAPPELDGDGTVDGEFEAMCRVAHATAALERRDPAVAVEQLEAAAQAAQPVSKALTGQIMGQLANAQLDEGGTQRASVTFQAALDQLEGTDLALSRAELHVAAGAMYQEMSEAAPRLMQQAINHYHQAMALVTAETAPETFAIANANLGLAYLTMPMQEASDQLRIGVAVQSMREALQIFTPESHGDRWSSTQLNLANALVYMPSKHQEQNLGEAVDLYEEVLAHRSRGDDPLGRARVLANQGNALAHLGAFDDAKARLHEARSLFEEFEEHEAVRTVRSVLDEIAKHESLARQDQAAADGAGSDHNGQNNGQNNGQGQP
jgi:tetratricopeptide (TPR) repeat protein